MMSQCSKREMIEAIHLHYLKAGKAGKEQIPDEFAAATGYHHKYAVRLLKHGSMPRGLKKAGYRKINQGKVIQALDSIQIKFTYSLFNLYGFFTFLIYFFYGILFLVCDNNIK